MRISVAADEDTGVATEVVEELRRRGHEVVTHGVLAPGERDDWAWASEAAARDVATGRADQAVVCCWTGTGASIAANKVAGVRAALCVDAATVIATLSGQESGVGAFMEGRLTVRGSLGLALLFEGALSTGERDARFPRPATVAVGGIRTPYLDAGPPDAPAVVVLHGLGATNASMLPTVWELATDHRVIAPDLPGFGVADKPSAPYSAEWFGRWLEDFCDELELDSFFLLGNSLGGRIAIEGGLLMPYRVRGLVLLTPSPAFRKLRQFVPVVRLLRPELAVVPLPVSHATAVAGLRKLFAVPDRIRQSWYEAAADEFLRVMGDPRARIAFFAAMRQIYLEEAFGDRGFWERLPGLRPPALFVWGERDRLVPHGFARHVVQALPSCQSVVLRDCGHVPQFELPARTHALVRSFLDSSGGEPETAPPRTPPSGP